MRLSKQYIKTSVWLCVYLIICLFFASFAYLTFSGIGYYNFDKHAQLGICKISNIMEYEKGGYRFKVNVYLNNTKIMSACANKFFSIVDGKEYRDDFLNTYSIGTTHYCYFLDETECYCCKASWDDDYTIYIKILNILTIFAIISIIILCIPLCVNYYRNKRRRKYTMI